MGPGSRESHVIGGLLEQEEIGSTFLQELRTSLNTRPLPCLTASPLPSSSPPRPLPQDLAGVQKLQKRLALLEADVAAHREQIDALSTQARQFVEAGHFDSEAISERQQALEGRYQGLKVRR